MGGSTPWLARHVDHTPRAPFMTRPTRRASVARPKCNSLNARSMRVRSLASFASSRSRTRSSLCIRRRRRRDTRSSAALHFCKKEGTVCRHIVHCPGAPESGVPWLLRSCLSSSAATVVGNTLGSYENPCPWSANLHGTDPVMANPLSCATLASALDCRVRRWPSSAVGVDDKCCPIHLAVDVLFLVFVARASLGMAMWRCLRRALLPADGEGSSRRLASGNGCSRCLLLVSFTSLSSISSGASVLPRAVCANARPTRSSVSLESCVCLCLEAGGRNGEDVPLACAARQRGAIVSSRALRLDSSAGAVVAAPRCLMKGPCPW